LNTPTPPLIDIHSHFVPDGFPGAPDDETAKRWPCMCHNPDGSALLKLGSDPFRTLDNRSWAMDRRIADMDADGVAMQVLSPMPELLSYWFAADAAIGIASHVNDAIANIVAQRPDRFQGLGMVPLQNITATLAMLPQIMADGLRGIEVGSNINGRYLGEDEFAPLFAAAADLDLAIFVHALHPLTAPHTKSWPAMVPFAGFVSDTGLCAASIIMSGVMERHPGLRIAFSHGGGTLPTLVHRLQKGFDTTGGFSGKLSVGPNDIAARFFLDSLVYDAPLARHLSHIAPGRVCLGTDYPYLIEQKDPRAFIQTVATGTDDAIWNAAARAFIMGKAG